MIHARLSPEGRLSEIARRPSSFPDDVPLQEMPSGFGPWEYDAASKSAKPATTTPEERVRRHLGARFPEALALRLSAAWQQASSQEQAAVQRVLDEAGSALLQRLRG